MTLLLPSLPKAAGPEGPSAESINVDLLKALPYDAAAKAEVLPVRIRNEQLVVEVGSHSDRALAQKGAKNKQLEFVAGTSPKWRESLAERLHALYSLGADRRALSHVRPPIAIAYDALPLMVVEGLEPELVVAMADPNDETKVDAVGAHARMKLKVKSCDRDVLRKAIRLAYHLDKMLEFRAARLRRAPVRRQLDDLVLELYEQGGQNLLIEPLLKGNGGMARFGIDGVKYERYRYEQAEYEQLINAIYNQAVGRGSKAEIGEGQFEIEAHMKQLYLRVVMMEEAFTGKSAAIRVHDLDTQPMTFVQAGLSGDPLKQLELALEQKTGAFPIVGKGDSGKTMTAVAILRRLPLDSMKFMGVGDPCEFYVPYIGQVNIHPSRPYQRIIEGFLRASADGFIAGEVRTAETAAQVYDTAQSGGLVTLTSHADDAIVAVNKLSRGVDRTVIAGITRAIIGQSLLRRLCILCRVDTKGEGTLIPDGSGRREKYVAKKNDDGSMGCAACAFTGYSGRIGVFEVMRVNRAVAFAIEQGVGPVRLADIASKYGYKPRVYDAYDKVEQGVTDMSEVQRELCTVQDDSRPEDLIA